MLRIEVMQCQPFPMIGKRKRGRKDGWWNSVKSTVEGKFLMETLSHPPCLQLAKMMSLMALAVGIS